jgi:hypothetical protein
MKYLSLFVFGASTLPKECNFQLHNSLESVLPRTHLNYYMVDFICGDHNEMLFVEVVRK